MITEPDNWEDDAACLTTDPDMFFSENTHDIMRAKKFCNTKCDVRAQCLKRAIDDDEQHGVWGGTSRPDRIRIRKLRKAS